MCLQHYISISYSEVTDIGHFISPNTEECAFNQKHEQLGRVFISLRRFEEKKEILILKRKG
jgi:hypothetical protein